MIINSILLIIIVVVLIASIIKKRNDEDEKFVNTSNVIIDEPTYGQYFNPYFVPPSTCMETLFGTVECYDLPSSIWSDNWWYNR